MHARKFLPGFAAGFAAGYALLRLGEAVTPRIARRRSADASRSFAFAQDDQKAQSYGRLQRAFAVAGIARSLASAAAAAFGEGAARIDHGLEGTPAWLATPAYAAAFCAINAIVDLPAGYVEDYDLERRYGLSEQSLHGWFEDRGKAFVLELVVTSLLAAALGGLVRKAPRAWPAIGSAAALPLLVAANVVIPLYVLPLFNAYKPLEGPLEARLRRLASRFGVGDAQLLRVDMSRRTKKANAFVTGIGHTHRIVVGDTLIENFSEDEIEFIVAHELGHYVKKDSWRMIAAAELATAAALYGSAQIMRYGGRDRRRPSAVAEMYFWIALLSQLLRPPICAFTRSREWAADRFALAATEAPACGASAFRKLREQNLAEDEQPAWFEFLFSTHPSLRSRIAALSQPLGK